MAAKNILMVEGKDDQHVLQHLSSTRGGPRFDEIIVCGSDTQLLEGIPVRLKAAGDTAVAGVVIDADTDLATRWHSLRDRFIRLGYRSLPITPSPDGTIIDPPGGAFLPRVGIWIMPDNQRGGILEDFLRFLVPIPSTLFDHVTASVRSIPEDERRFAARDESKALIHTWLAWQEKPGRPLGTAITARFLEPDVPQVDALVSWLKRLFVQ